MAQPGRRGKTGKAAVEPLAPPTNSRCASTLSSASAHSTPEEILLELKRLASGHDLSFEIGLNYRFGSIYSNVVNPRFGNI
jgi:hypothetical protein